MAEVSEIKYLDKDGKPGALGEQVHAVAVYLTSGRKCVLQRGDFDLLPYLAAMTEPEWSESKD